MGQLSTANIKLHICGSISKSLNRVKDHILDDSPSNLCQITRMKYLAILLSVTLATPLLAAPPRTIEDAVNKRDHVVKKANEELVKDLTRLKNVYTKQGNLKKANEADKLIAGIKSKVVTTDSARRHVQGKWKFIPLNSTRKSSYRTFEGAIVSDGRGGRHSWRYEDDHLIIPWGRGQFDKVKLNLLTPDTMTGVNSEGMRFKLVRSD